MAEQRRTCGIRDTASRGVCGAPADASAPLDLCTRHLLAAYEWVAGEVGVTDALPSPCLACGSRLGVRYPSGWLCAVCEWRLGERPDDDETAPVRVDVVYYVRFGDRIKIGTSANPRGRLNQLHVDELLALERGTRLLEQRRHVQFAAHRLGGEWFAPHEALDEHIAALAAGVDDPWALYDRWRSEALALAGARRP
ncbi:GIY-YIG nuclease family protein [Herbiconiux sp. P16]|uniref:GIY-YIG nuclease family protein n=1 Tax=Herbiconiux wuyangfengii TaxID=3342794 RepID=UPI0035B8C89C